MIAHDDRCELGQWLHGDAKRRYASVAAYSQCVEAHARFHREAGRVVDFINKGDFATAEKELDVASRFGEASTGAVVAINKLKRAM